MRLSRNLTLIEGIRSATAKNYNISNIPSEKHMLNMFILANNCFQPIRDYFDNPIYVSSFYRSEELNVKVGGSKNSDHTKGCAIDLDADVFGGLDNKDIFNFVKENLDFKLLIWEFGDDFDPDWVHISYEFGSNDMKRILRAEYDENGQKQYVEWK